VSSYPFFLSLIITVKGCKTETLIMEEDDLKCGVDYPLPPQPDIAGSSVKVMRARRFAQKLVSANAAQRCQHLLMYPVRPRAPKRGRKGKATKPKAKMSPTTVRNPSSCVSTTEIPNTYLLAAGNSLVVDQLSPDAWREIPAPFGWPQQGKFYVPK
jgi:hypothetical protein